MYYILNPLCQYEGNLSGYDLRSCPISTKTTEHFIHFRMKGVVIVEEWIPPQLLFVLFMRSMPLETQPIYGS